MRDLERSFERIRRHLTQADIADLSLPFQLHHGFHGLFDRGLFVDSMDVVEVDLLDAEAVEGSLAGGQAVFGRRVDRAFLGCELVGKLRDRPPQKKKKKERIERLSASLTLPETK